MTSNCFHTYVGLPIYFLFDLESLLYKLNAGEESRGLVVVQNSWSDPLCTVRGDRYHSQHELS
jgi:hypothetical protein